jgi:hypothetical protein
MAETENITLMATTTMINIAASSVDANRPTFPENAIMAVRHPSRVWHPRMANGGHQINGELC